MAPDKYGEINDDELEFLVADFQLGTVQNQHGATALYIAFRYTDGNVSPAHLLSRESIDSIIIDLMRYRDGITYSNPITIEGPGPDVGVQ